MTPDKRAFASTAPFHGHASLAGGATLSLRQREASHRGPNKMKDALTAIDLFAGCGGLSLGLRRAEFRVLGGVEIDPIAAATYELNHPGVDLRQENILKVKPRKWMSDLGLRSGDLDLLAGCPPCQGYSAIRTKNGGRQNA